MPTPKTVSTQTERLQAMYFINSARSGRELCASFSAEAFSSSAVPPPAVRDFHSRTRAAAAAEVASRPTPPSESAPVPLLRCRRRRREARIASTSTVLVVVVVAVVPSYSRVEAPPSPFRPSRVCSPQPLDDVVARRCSSQSRTPRSPYTGAAPKPSAPKMDQTSIEQLRQLMQLQAATTQPSSTTATNPFVLQPDPSSAGALHDLLFQQQIQQHQQLAALAAASGTQSHSAFRPANPPQAPQQGSAFTSAAAATAAANVAVTQPSALLPYIMGNVPTTTTSTDFLAQMQMFNLLQQQQQQQQQPTLQQQQNLLLQQLALMQAQQLFVQQQQQQPEPMQVSSAAPTMASSPQLSTSPVPMRPRAQTYAVRPPPKVAHKRKQIAQQKQETSVLRALCECSDDEETSPGRPNSAPNDRSASATKRRAVDPESPDRHHPKNLIPSNDQVRIMESKVAMYLMGGGPCAMDVDSVLNEGLNSDDSPSKTSSDSGYTSRSASNGGNAAPATTESDSEDIHVIYEKFKHDPNVPCLEALVFPTRSPAFSPNGDKAECRDRISSFSLPMPVFDRMVDNVLNTCLA
uniref:Uncharacterized protein n=1 Tax=Steinernema glaseri TaxID=37863 RepID=A0A1I7XXT5_9BILA